MGSVQAFSFGVCLYEMIAAKDPWEGETHGQVAYQVRPKLQITLMDVSLSCV